MNKSLMLQSNALQIFARFSYLIAVVLFITRLYILVCVIPTLSANMDLTIALSNITFERYSKNIIDIFKFFDYTINRKRVYTQKK